MLPVQRSPATTQSPVWWGRSTWCLEVFPPIHKQGSGWCLEPLLCRINNNNNNNNNRWNNKGQDEITEQNGIIICLQQQKSWRRNNNKKETRLWQQTTTTFTPENETQHQHSGGKVCHEERDEQAMVAESNAGVEPDAIVIHARYHQTRGRAILASKIHIYIYKYIHIYTTGERNSTNEYIQNINK